MHGLQGCPCAFPCLDDEEHLVQTYLCILRSVWDHVRVSLHWLLKFLVSLLILGGAPARSLGAYQTLVYPFHGSRWWQGHAIWYLVSHFERTPVFDLSHKVPYMGTEDLSLGYGKICADNYNYKHVDDFARLVLLAHAHRAKAHPWPTERFCFHNLVLMNRKKLRGEIALNCILLSGNLNYQ